MNVKISIPNQEAHPTFGNLLVLVLVQVSFISSKRHEDPLAQRLKGYKANPL